MPPAMQATIIDSKTLSFARLSAHSTTTDTITGLNIIFKICKLSMPFTPLNARILIYCLKQYVLFRIAYACIFAYVFSHMYFLHLVIKDNIAWKCLQHVS